MFMPHIKFQDSSISGSQVSQLPSITDRQMDGWMDGQTDGQAQTNMPPQLLRSWRHKKLTNKFVLYADFVNICVSILYIVFPTKKVN